MHFLLLNQFYPPDAAPTGWYLHGLARELVRRGHSVKALCSRRSYDGKDSFPRRENLDGVEVSRLPATGFGRRGFVGKMADYGSFYISLATALLFDRSKPDLILSLTTPPYIGLLGKAAAGKCGCRHAHWIMDLYPDVMFAHRMARDDGLLFRFLRKLTRWQLRGAQTVISLGPYMAEKVAAYGFSTFSVDSRTSSRGLGSAIVPVAVGHVSRPTPLPVASHGSLFRLAASNDRAGQNVFGGTPNTACETHALPEIAVTWIPLWSDPELVPWPATETNSLRAERGWDDEDVVFLYSGNMGLGHRFTEFLEAARRLSPKAKAEIGKASPFAKATADKEGRNHRSELEGGSTGPRWVFSGGGKRRREIEIFAESHPTARMEFLDYVPQSRLRAHLCAADVHLASLDSAWQGLIVPSKIQASFAVARPVLFVGGRECETAAWIEESGGGWVVDQDDLDGLMQAIQQALNPAERQRRGQAALAFARQNFQMSENCARIAELLEDKKQKVES